MITAINSASIYEASFSKPVKQKSTTEQELIDIVESLQAESRGGVYGDLGKPYTLPSNNNESIQERTVKLEAIFSESLSEIMAERGIKSDPPFELETYLDGRVRVQGEHPQKGDIEQIFQDNQELENLFRGIAGNHALVKAFDEHLKFQEEYRIDQVKALLKYASLFDDSSDKNTRMKMDESGAISWSVYKSV